VGRLGKHRPPGGGRLRHPVQLADFGIQFNEVDMPAFRKAADPLLQQYLQQPELAALTRRIRDFA